MSRSQRHACPHVSAKKSVMAEFRQPPPLEASVTGCNWTGQLLESSTQGWKCDEHFEDSRDRLSTETVRRSRNHLVEKASNGLARGSNLFLTSGRQHTCGSPLATLGRVAGRDVTRRKEPLISERMPTDVVIRIHDRGC